MDNKKIKILLVDDEEMIRTTYAEIFTQEGFEVVEAIDGLEGLDKATKENPNIIITGIIMPRMDGFSLKEALSKNVSTSNIPVMMLSHMGREEDRKKSQEFGIKEFIVQGMTTPKEVVDKIRSFFEPEGYNLKICTEDLDAPKIIKDLQLVDSFKCPNCMSEMFLNLKKSNLQKREFLAKIFCPKCGKN